MDEKAKNELLKAAKLLAEKTKPKPTGPRKQKPTWERDAEADYQFVVDAYNKNLERSPRNG